MANVYDAIVIGGGHNGLISGGFFAKNGAQDRRARGSQQDRRRRRHQRARSPDHPDIKVTTYSYVMSLMPPTIIQELQLERHGYNVTPFGPYFQAYPGRPRDHDLRGRRQEEQRVDRRSSRKKDADTHPRSGRRG